MKMEFHFQFATIALMQLMTQCISHTGKGQDLPCYIAKILRECNNSKTSKPQSIFDEHNHVGTLE